MFEREELQTEFAELIAQGRKSAESLNKLITECDDILTRDKLTELAEHAARHLTQLERLTEIIQ